MISTRVGYTGGHVESPTYEQVCTGTTGHAEAIEVVFDPTKVTYRELAQLYFETHDPTQLNGQGPDIGSQYRGEIFYYSDAQKAIAEELIEHLKTTGLAVVTQVTPASTFWPASASLSFGESSSPRPGPR